MGKVTQVNNGDIGLVARTNWNEAMKTVEIDASLTGDGTTGTPLGVDLLNDDTFATANTTQAATSQSVKNYVDNQIGGIYSTKSYSIGKVAIGIHYLAGYYEAPSTDANLTQASTTQTLGTANVSYAARPFLVSGGAGVTDGSDLVITISGTSITDAGVRTAADSEVLVADATASVLNQYYEPQKKFIGQVTYTLSSTGGTAFSYDFNYGWAKYEDFGNRDFTIQDFEVVGACNVTDTGFNLTLLLHDGTGWTYAATGFVPGGTVICDMNTDHNTEINVQNGDSFAYKRSGLNTPINGDGPEGVVIEITQGSNNTIDSSSFHLGVDLSASEIT